MQNYFLMGFMINMMQNMHANAQNITNSKTHFSFFGSISGYLQLHFHYKHTAVTVAAVQDSIVSTWSVIIV